MALPRKFQHATPHYNTLSQDDTASHTGGNQAVSRLTSHPYPWLASHTHQDINGRVP